MLTRQPSELIDSEHYALTELHSPAMRAVIDAQRQCLVRRGVAILPGFVRPDVVDEIAREALALQVRAHLEDAWGTPYLVPVDGSYREGHPRRALEHSLTWVIAYDLIPRSSLVRVLYEWDPLMQFIGEILDRRPLYRMADPLGALNLTVMTEGHQQGWHYDNADFVVSLAVQSSCAGGKFECAPFIRSTADENYDEVAAVLQGSAGERVEIFPMTPGTLMIFAGRNSLHRVSTVEGSVPRIVGLLAYDTKPDTDSSPLFKLVRYGRDEALAE
jgi:hypothetical protein